MAEGQLTPFIRPDISGAVKIHPLSCSVAERATVRGKEARVGKVSSETSGDGLMRDYNHDTFVTNSGYAPGFLARARLKQKQAMEQMFEVELSTLRDRISELERENDKLRASIRESLISSPAAKSAEELNIALENITDRIPVSEIIRRVSEKHGVSVQEIKGPRRERHVVEARFKALALAYDLRPDLSLVQIGREFGGRDHTTVLKALRRMGRKLPKSS